MSFAHSLHSEEKVHSTSMYHSSNVVLFYCENGGKDKERAHSQGL